MIQMNDYEKTALSYRTFSIESNKLKAPELYRFDRIIEVM